MGSTEPLSREQYKSIGPYSTKVLHKNKHNMAYTTIGDPYDRTKRDRNPRWSKFSVLVFVVFGPSLSLSHEQLECSLTNLYSQTRVSSLTIRVATCHPFIDAKCQDGTQFATASLKSGNIPAQVLFQKDMTFGPFGKLQEANNYRRVERKKGFGTSDAPKLQPQTF